MGLRPPTAHVLNGTEDGGDNSRTFVFRYQSQKEGEQRVQVSQELGAGTGGKHTQRGGGGPVSRLWLRLRPSRQMGGQAGQRTGTVTGIPNLAGGGQRLGQRCPALFLRQVGS